jgi:hypothetical protein
MKSPLPVCLSTLLLALATTAVADVLEFHLVVHNHRFEPTTLAVPAGQKIKLVVENLDATPEEFESHALKREKLVPGKSKAIVMIGPLKPGSYSFYGEFNPQTATGSIVAR